jgi:leucine dehydrogenase
MDLFKAMSAYSHEQLVFCQEPSCGYLGIVAIHDTTLGPGVGGTRYWQYATTEEAIVDSLRLSRGMTYKSAVAGIAFGGGKSVIIGDNRRKDREAIFRAHGRFVESLGGRYVAAEDIGTTPSDMEIVRLETSHVAGLPGRSGDPSPVTSYGIYVGMKATAKVRWGSDSLAGKTVAVQGCGKVGHNLCRHLHEEGATLIVTDVDPARVKAVVAETGAKAVAPDEIYDQKADIYSPNALGATVNDDTLRRLKVEVIAGGANNQLAEERHGEQLERQGLSYAPDYVINGGGIINVYGETAGWEHERSRKKAGEIYDTILNVFAIAKRDGVPTSLAADRLAEERIASVRALKRLGR